MAQPLAARQLIPLLAYRDGGGGVGTDPKLELRDDAAARVVEVLVDLADRLAPHLGVLGGQDVLAVDLAQKVNLPLAIFASSGMSMQKSWELSASMPISTRSG